jgi:flagellar P-ring protein precursor FlgI
MIRNMMHSRWLAAIVLFISSLSYAERIKDIAVVHGVRSNQLYGYGLVVGLNGTGDSLQARFTLQSLAAMLGRMGVRVDPTQIQVRNVAAVMVTAELPPFARAGTHIDVVVSSLGNARSLQGGTLVFTPLKGADDNIYAVAQGPLSVGGFEASSGGASVTKNHTTVGRIPQGALVEREVPAPLNGQDVLQLDLLVPDFTTAARMVEVVNKQLAGEVAQALDPSTIRLAVPVERKQKLVSLVAEIEGLEIQTDQRARVVINARTGTVVLGDQVRISTVAISHGNLHLEVKPHLVTSQPGPFSTGKTVVGREDEINVREDKSQVVVIQSGPTLGDVVRALNTIGATPRDLIEILQAIRAAGALPASLEIL